MKSMTGYGSAEGKVGKGQLFTEVKSVNHRYCDLNIKIPPKMNAMDPQLRKLIQQKVERGKVDLFMKEKKWIASEKKISVDLELARKYQRSLENMQKQLGLKKIDLLEVIDLKDLVQVEEKRVDYSRYAKEIGAIVKAAIVKMDKMRIKEGAFLLKDQKMRLKSVTSLIKKVDAQSAVSLKKYQQRLKAKAKTNGTLREGLNIEVASLADKIDIAEEITRLRSHIDQYGKTIGKKGAIGRQLDFLLQEMNRETNTIGAKSGDAKISTFVIGLKGELEKLREQVQNIE